MQLDNQTPFAARLLSIQRGEQTQHGIVVVKSTFELDENRRAAPAGEQLPIVMERLDTPFGVFHTDCFVRKEGVDVCVLGTVRPGAPTKLARLRLEVGGHRSELCVFGDRRWVKAGSTLQASEPEPFDAMPLAYARAYGGLSEHDHEPILWPDNPVGRGYYLSLEQAEGQPLPNIEAAAGPALKSWEEQPPVAGWAPYPLFWGLRAKEGVEVVDPEQPFGFRVKARINNQAHPELVLPRLEPDAVIRIQGMRERELVFPVPHPALVVEVDVGGRKLGVEAELDGVFVWADAERVTLTHRAHFLYTYRKGERRVARLARAA